MTKFWRYFISNGQSRRVDRSLGLYGHGAPVARSANFRLGLGKGRGVEVHVIEPNGPAEEAGILEGDILITLAGHRTSSLGGLHRLLGELPAQIAHPVLLLRRGQPLERHVVLNDYRKPIRKKRQFP